MAESNDSSRPKSGGIEGLEFELIVRDFVTMMNERSFDDLAAYLHTDVRYRPDGRSIIRGRDAVLRMCRDIAGSFDGWCTELLQVAVTGNVVLAEEWVNLAVPGGEPQWVMGFSSYRLDNFRIVEWRRLHA